MNDRLEVITDIQLEGERTNYGPAEEFRLQWGEKDEKGVPEKQILVKPFVMPWLSTRIEESLMRRERRPKKRKEEAAKEEEEEEEEEEERWSDSEPVHERMV
jgi:hypothetical protein